MTLEHLSNIELFYSEEIVDNKIILRDDEFNHCINVLRNRIKDLIYVTDGKGNLYKSQILETEKKFLISKILEKTYYNNETENYFICIPLLKNKDRFRFAIEKSVELGITRFIFFKSERTLVKKFDESKIKKIFIESLKQSLRTHLPQFHYFNTIPSLIKNIFENNNIFIFDINTNNIFNFNFIDKHKINYFIIGPEGGLSKDELELFDANKVFRFSKARLRSETAILKLVALIT